MDKLFANMSVGLAKTGMNRRGFLGSLVRATTGAVILTGLTAKSAFAQDCGGPYFCMTSEYTYCGSCKECGCSYSEKPTILRQEGVHCFLGFTCSPRDICLNCNCDTCP